MLGITYIFILHLALVVSQIQAFVARISNLFFTAPISSSLVLKSQLLSEKFMFVQGC